MANWSSLGGNQTTTLNEQRQSQFPSWSPLGGNSFLRHEERSGTGSSSGGNRQTNYLSKPQGWLATASQGDHGEGPSHELFKSAKHEKVEDPRSHGIGRLDNQTIFQQDKQPATVTPGRVASPSFENCASRVNTTSMRESEKMKNLRQHLLILLHAHKCQSKLRSGLLDECKVPFCATMRGVLEHMKSCRVSGQWQCPVPHCTTSYKILGHWKSCKKQSCHVCTPFKQPNMARTETMSPSASPGAIPHLQQHQETPVLQQELLGKASSHFSQTNSFEKGQDQAWRNSISSELRSHLVDKMLLVLKSSSN